MLVQYYDSKFEVPDLLIEKFTKDFDGLPGSGRRDSINEIRTVIYDTIDYAIEDPEILEEADYRNDFIKALAMMKALENYGLLYDA